MNKQERLFSAIGGADEALLERSENRGKQKRGVWLCWSLAAAACVAVVIGCVSMFRPTPPDTVPDGSGPVDVLPAQDGAEGGTEDIIPPEQVVLPESGSAAGSFHFLSFRYEKAEEAAPDFYLYVDEETYTVVQQGGAYVIQSKQPLGPELPACYLEITHMANTTLQAAAEITHTTLAASYQEVSEISESARGLYLRASDGNAWDDAQREVECTGDGAGGVFLLSVNYFLEAAEGHGVRLRDMVNTFQVVGADTPAWITALQDTVEEVLRTALKDQLSQELLTEDAVVSCYGRDVTGEVSVAGIDYTVDDAGEVPTAVVSVRLNRLEDTADFLTMELRYEGRRWLVSFVGLEK